MEKGKLGNINEEILEKNTAFYTYMKRIYCNEYRLDTDVIKTLISRIHFELSAGKSLGDIKLIILHVLDQVLKGKKKESKLLEYERIVSLWTETYSLKLFLLALYMILIKDSIGEKLSDEIREIRPEGHPLSIKYDNISVTIAYRKRAVALLAAASICDFYSGLLRQRPDILSRFSNVPDSNIKKIMKEVSDYGVNVSSMFGIVMNESVNQSIISTAGGGYEDRIYDLLLKIGIPKENIERLNHDETGSIEHDFIFKLNNKKYGISAKRTLRERYKQYVNLLQNRNADILLTITFGTDLSEAKAKTIRGFGVYIFIAPEIYNSQEKLRNVEGVYSIDDFNINLLKRLN